jgi:hypothetical protein
MVYFSIIGTSIGDELSFGGIWMDAVDMAVFVESEQLVVFPHSRDVISLAVPDISR